MRFSFVHCTLSLCTLLHLYAESIICFAVTDDDHLSVAKHFLTCNEPQKLNKKLLGFITLTRWLILL